MDLNQSALLCITVLAIVTAVIIGTDQLLEFIPTIDCNAEPMRPACVRQGWIENLKGTD